MTINTFFELEDEGSKEYRALYWASNYDIILKKLTKGKSEWKRNISNQVQSFMRTGLTETTKSWLYFVFSKLILKKHVSTMQKDKAILTYAIVSGMKSNVGTIIENSILESVCGKAITHLSLITKHCLRVEMEISKDEKKCAYPHPQFLSHSH